jgi:hypothetical protein
LTNGQEFAKRHVLAQTKNFHRGGGYQLKMAHHEVQETMLYLYRKVSPDQGMALKIVL